MKNTAVLLFIILIACRKERFTADAAALLFTSADTLRFDTVFTSTGSVTQVFKIFNPANEGIRIASIKLAGGAASSFVLNANGAPGPLISNLEIAARDSAYVFAAVTINPTAATLPFLVQDSILIDYNGNKKIIQLEAYGQAARFLRNHHITGNETWHADLPYVLLGACVIEKDAHLTIKEGCKIYFHADAPLVVEGRLTVEGQKWDSTKVVFAGNRLDAPYRELPGSWPGIVFKNTSGGNSIRHAVIKNAYRAISVEASPRSSKLQLSETVIDHAADAGIFAEGGTIAAQNLLVRNCGKGLVLHAGGDYGFTHATVASFSTTWLQHNEPALTISNAATGNGANELNAVFRNCIFWGEGNIREVVVEKRGTAPFNLVFDGVLWPSGAAPAAATIPVPPITDFPQFDSLDKETNRFDFHLKETSPARNSGVPAGVSLDLDGRPRPADAPDLGAYQKQ